jgi:hypothetical protein
MMRIRVAASESAADPIKQIAVTMRRSDRMVVGDDDTRRQRRIRNRAFGLEQRSGIGGAAAAPA